MHGSGPPRYIPLPTEKGVWTISHGDGKYSLYVYGDTIINEKKYIQLHEMIVSNSKIWDSYYLSYCEEDKKIYMRLGRPTGSLVDCSPVDTVDILVYDFSVGMGDTIFYTDQCAIWFDEIITLDTVFYFGKERIEYQIGRMVPKAFGIQWCERCTGRTTID